MPLTGLPLSELLTGGGAALLTQIANGVFGRKDRETKRLSDQLDRQDLRMERFEERLDECHENHETCERGRREDREEHARQIAELEAEVRRFMAGDSSDEIATYPGRQRRG